MKKLIYVLAVTVLGLTACADGGGNGYKVIGTVEGAADGDTVFIQEVVNRDLMKRDTAIIIAGKFTFEGKQDSAVNRYVTYINGDKRYMADFFLENGDIHANLAQNSSVTGTTTNNAYQAFKDKMNTLQQQQSIIYESVQNETLTDEQKQAKTAEADAKDSEMTALVTQTIEANMTNALGLYLLGQYNFIMDFETIEPLLAKVPATKQDDPTVVRLGNLVAVAKSTAIGQKFVDFEMNTPEGKPVKLSDFAGKGKYVLVDFWASWCGPCRREMPNLVKAYKEYKSKGFEIVGVSLDKNLEAWQNSIKSLDITWPQMSDLKFWDCEGAKLYAVRSIPYVVLINPEGIIIAKGLHGEELQAKLAEIFKK